MSLLLNVCIDEYGEVIGVSVFENENGLNDFRNEIIEAKKENKYLDVVNEKCIVGCGEESYIFYIDLNLCNDDNLNVLKYSSKENEDGSYYTLIKSDERVNKETEYNDYCEGVCIDYCGEGWGQGSVSEMYMNVDVKKLLKIKDKVLKDMRYCYS